MARYIDADALLRNTIYNTRHVPYITRSDVAEVLTADAVEIVRCKDCKHSVKHKLGYGCGMNYRLATNGEWFCADGERKEDEEST